MTTQKKTKMLTHKQMVSKMLKKPAVKAAVKELDRTEFAILDEILAARKEAGLTQAQVAKKMGTQTPAIARLENSLGKRIVKSSCLLLSALNSTVILPSFVLPPLELCLGVSPSQAPN